MSTDSLDPSSVMFTCLCLCMTDIIHVCVCTYCIALNFQGSKFSRMAVCEDFVEIVS